MKPYRLTLPIVVLLTLGLASFAFGQMMGGAHGSSAMDNTDSTSYGGMMMNGGMMNGGMMMNRGTMMKLGSMMGNMSNSCNMMSNDFSRLKSHFEEMMQIKDMKTLKAEMQKHHDMLNRMYDNMSKQHSMFLNMMSMMNSAGMNGMMGTNSTESGSTGPHAHTH